MHEAVILAAGLGKTVYVPYTLKTPKPLLPVQGKPIFTMDNACFCRVKSRVFLCCGAFTLLNKLWDWLTKQTNPVQWHVVRQEQPRGSGDAVLACRECIRGRSLSFA
jgi:UTP-glucose-1-phosphate uridylyltransferase